MIKYIAFYDNQINSKENRYVITSCQSKMEYVISVLNSIGEKVEVVSPSCTRESHGYFSAKRYSVNADFAVRLPASFGFHSVIGKVIRRLYQWIVTNCYVYHSIKKGDTVLAYHSVALSSVLCRLKKRKNIRLILHVEEIYADVTDNETYRRKEKEVFKYGDAFITPTKQLNEKVNLYKKPYAIAHGDYSTVARVVDRYDDGRIHCVYAGTFDSVKGGCKIAINAARHLDERFCLHIIGFGSRSETEGIKKLIDECRRVSSCEILFDGEKRGNDFKEYIQKCHIGLSTQNPDGNYNDSSFPSKILTYLVNGLSVVTVKIPVVETSDVTDCLFYYEGKDPESVANAIIECSQNLKKGGCDQVLTELNEMFTQNVKTLLQGC